MASKMPVIREDRLSSSTIKTLRKTAYLPAQPYPSKSKHFAVIGIAAGSLRGGADAPLRRAYRRML